MEAEVYFKSHFIFQVKSQSFTQKEAFKYLEAFVKKLSAFCELFSLGFTKDMFSEYDADPLRPYIVGYNITVVGICNTAHITWLAGSVALFLHLNNIPHFEQKTSFVKSDS